MKTKVMGIARAALASAKKVDWPLLGMLALLVACVIFLAWDLWFMFSALPVVVQSWLFVGAITLGVWYVCGFCGAEVLWESWLSYGRAEQRAWASIAYFATLLGGFLIIPGNILLCDGLLHLRDPGSILAVDVIYFTALFAAWRGVRVALGDTIDLGWFASLLRRWHPPFFAVV